jgi:hypothetical protein
VGYPDSVNPAIAIDSRDNIHAAWYQYSKAVKSYTISYRERSAASGSWEAQEQLSGDLDTALNVSLAVDRHDRVYVAWEGTLRAQQGSSIFLRVKEDGRWGLPLQVVPASLQASEPSVAIDGADRVYVFYQCGLDSAIHVTRLDGGTILPDEKVGGQAPSGYPNARWSFHDSRSSRHPLEIDYAWTESQDPSGFAAGENFIRVGKVGPAAANERP